MNMPTNRVVKNASWVIASKLLQALMGLVVSMLTARYLGPSNYGLINYASSIVAFAAPLMQLGISSVLVYEFVKGNDPDNVVLGSALVLNVISSIACFAGIIAFVSIANPGEEETLIVCILYSLQLFAQAVENIQYWFQAKLLSKYTSIISVIAYFIVSVYKIILLATHMELYWFAIAQGIDCFIIVVGLVISYFRISRAHYRFSLACAKRLLSTGKHYIIANMMVAIYAQTDKVMLKIMLGDKVNGIYAAAVTCAGVTSFVFAAIINTMQPIILENKMHSQGTYEQSVRRLYAMVIWGAMLQSILFTLFATPMVSILFGAAYMDSVRVLRLLVWYTTFSYLGAVRNIWMLAEQCQHLIWRINIFGALANVVLNLALIPPMGAMGAALASLITQFFTNVLMGYIISQVRENNRLMLQSLRPSVMIDIIKNIRRSFL